MWRNWLDAGAVSPKVSSYFGKILKVSMPLNSALGYHGRTSRCHLSEIYL